MQHFLLVAIAVVGGSIVFVFSQGFFSSAQISGAPTIESPQILPAMMQTDGAVLEIHDGVDSGVAQGATANDGLLAGERIAVYLQKQQCAKKLL